MIARCDKSVRAGRQRGHISPEPESMVLQISSSTTLAPANGYGLVAFSINVKKPSCKLEDERDARCIIFNARVYVAVCNEYEVLRYVLHQCKYSYQSEECVFVRTPKFKDHFYIWEFISLSTSFEQ
jgi:hypothetical protein